MLKRKAVIYSVTLWLIKVHVKKKRKEATYNLIKNKNVYVFYEIHIYLYSFLLISHLKAWFHTENLSPSLIWLIVALQKLTICNKRTFNSIFNENLQILLFNKRKEIPQCYEKLNLYYKLYSEKIGCILQVRRREIIKLSFC